MARKKIYYLLYNNIDTSVGGRHWIYNTNIYTVI